MKPLLRNKIGVGTSSFRGHIQEFHYEIPLEREQDLVTIIMQHVTIFRTGQVFLRVYARR